MIYISVEDGRQVVNLTKSDDAVLTLDVIQADGSAYELAADEYIYFTVRELPVSTSPVLFEARSVNGSNLIPFAHSATSELTPGFYSAEAQLMTSDGQRVTVWPRLEGGARTSSDNRRNFCVMTEVTLQ